MKVLHLPETVGGNAWSLSQAERAIGLESRVLTLYGNGFAYPVDENLNLETRTAPGRLLGHLQAFLRHRTGYDVYHFNFGTSPLHIPKLGLSVADLPFYDSRARKVMTYQGCDARQKFPTMARATAQGTPAACLEADCYGGICNSGQRDAVRKRAIEKAAKYIDHMFSVNPDLLYFLPEGMSSFVPYTVTGFYDLKPRVPAPRRDGTVHIVHAPTQRGAKGTPYILAALARLQEEFPNRVVVRLVENLSHAEALAAYADADLMIDQTLVGWYGGVAVEAMRLGVPVAAYINPDHLRYIPSAMADDLPFIQITPDTLADSLRPYILDPDRLPDVAARSLRYASRWHDPVTIARHIATVYRGDPVADLAPCPDAPNGPTLS